MSRLTVITRAAALLGLCVLTGCGGEAPALADAAVQDGGHLQDGGHSDAGADAAADAAEDICIGAQAEPLAGCVRPTDPDTACSLRVESGEHSRIAATFDAAGRLTSSSDGFFGEVRVFDAAGQRTRWERVDRRCLMTRTLYWRDGDRIVRRVEEPDDQSKCRTDTLVGGFTIERIVDEGCDCEDTWFDTRCDVEDGRPIRCEREASDGRSRGVVTWAWTADGLLARQAEDFDADGVEDHIETFEYDATGRVTVEVETHTDCEHEAWCTQRRTWTYEDDLRRTTQRFDDGDDGSIDHIERTAVDGIGRRVLFEFSFDEGETWTVNAWTREVDGNRTTITRTINDVVRAVIVEETDDAGRLLSRAEHTDQGAFETLDLAYDGDGHVVEERRTVDADGYAYACAADYTWQGDACPDLRVQTDADVTPLEQDFQVGIHCISRDE